MNDRTSKFIFLISSALLLFVAGFGAGGYVYLTNSWPYDNIVVVRDHLVSFMRAGVWAPRGFVVIPPKYASRERITLHRPEDLQPGYRAVMGAAPHVGEYDVWLYDDAGKLVHEWQIGQKQLAGRVSPGEINSAHGMKVLPDGSVLTNLDHQDTLMRIDACSNVMWIQAGHSHHSLDVTPDGKIWSWEGEKDASSPEQFIVERDLKTGKVLDRISLTKDIIEASPENAALLRIPQGHWLTRDPSSHDDDIFHPNDVEELKPDLAPSFPQFAVGDLLISIRNINLVAVLDPKTRHFKWWSYGPWYRQHDPDFEPDGRIWVYDNNPDRGQSEIAGIDPRTNDVKIFPYPKNGHFSSETMGKHQLLPNGSQLITVPHEGRVIELSKDGKLVWEFNNVFTADTNVHVANAEWLPLNYFTKLPSCDKKTAD